MGLGLFRGWLSVGLWLAYGGFRVSLGVLGVVALALGTQDLWLV